MPQCYKPLVCDKMYYFFHFLFILKLLPRQAYLFTLVAIEIFESLAFVKVLGGWIRKGTGEKASSLHLIQRVSVAVQRGNVAAILGNCILELLSVHMFRFIYFIAIYSY